MLRPRAGRLVYGDVLCSLFMQEEDAGVSLQPLKAPVLPFVAHSSCAQAERRQARFITASGLVKSGIKELGSQIEHKMAQCRNLTKKRMVPRPGPLSEFEKRFYPTVPALVLPRELPDFSSLVLRCRRRRRDRRQACYASLRRLPSGCVRKPATS